MADDLRERVTPLAELDHATRERIERQVAMPEPPSRWIRFGGPDDNYPLAQTESRSWYEWHWQRGINPPAEHREPIPKHLRTAVIARDGYVCQLCQQPVQPADVHLDHIKPYSKGGRHTLANLQVTHSRCNLRKGAKYDGEDQGI